MREFDADPGWTALTEHWLHAARMHTLSTSARAWACKFMLADLAARHTTEELAPIRNALRALTSAG